MNAKSSVKITLTPQQQAQVQQATGQPVTSLKLEALEHRLAPGVGIN